MIENAKPMTLSDRIYSLAARAEEQTLILSKNDDIEKVDKAVQLIFKAVDLLKDAGL